MKPYGRLFRRPWWTVRHRISPEGKVVAWAAAAAVAIVLVFSLIENQRIEGVSTISAQTEVLEYKVINRDAVSFAVRGMKVIYGPKQMLDQCINGTVEPVLNSTVLYSRAGFGPFTIDLRVSTERPLASGETPPTAAILRSIDNGQSTELPAETEISWDPSCTLGKTSDEAIDLSRSPVPYTLPVWGEAILGSESRHSVQGTPEAATLISGKVVVLAHSIVGSLYPAREFSLPAGSRVESRSGAGTAQQSANWAGIVYLDPSRPGFATEVESDTTTLLLTRPNARSAEVIKLTGFKEVFDDPALILLYKFIGLIALVAAFADWLFKHREIKA